MQPNLHVGDIIDHVGLARARVTAVILAEDPEHAFTILEVEPLDTV